MNKYQEQIVTKFEETFAEYKSLVVETISNDELDRVIEALSRNLQHLDNQGWNTNVPEWAQVRFTQDEIRPMWNKWNSLRDVAVDMACERKQQERVDNMLKTIW